MVIFIPKIQVVGWKTFSNMINYVGFSEKRIYVGLFVWGTITSSLSVMYVPYWCKSNIFRCLDNNRCNNKGILQVVKCDLNIRIIKWNWLISFICVTKYWKPIVQCSKNSNCFGSKINWLTFSILLHFPTVDPGVEQ